MAVLVTGATGLLGRAVAKSLLADNIDVRFAGRSAERVRMLYGGVARAVIWDPAVSDFPPDALAGVDTIYHLMGEPVSGRWSKVKKERIITSRVTSAEKIGQAMAGSPCRLIAPSSFGLYPGRRGAVYDETTLASPSKTFIQSMIQAWEKAALLAARGQAKASVVRFGMVCSPEGYPKKLVRLFQKGLGFVAGDGNQIIPVVDIEDAVRMMRWVAQEGIDGRINCVAPRLPRARDISESIAQATGKPIRLTVPDWLARPILGGSADYFLLSYDIRPTRALEEGFTFLHTEPRAILARALAPYTH